jgi:hypothetical protein
MKPQWTCGLPLFLVAALTTFYSCKPQAVEPVEQWKDPRTFTWKLDTLDYPNAIQTLMERMHAVNEHNIYVLGHSDLATGDLFHWNGSRWEPVDLIWRITPYPGALELEDVFGFSGNDIWIVGAHSRLNPAPPPNFIDSNFIAHFDGTQWRKYPVPRGRKLQSVWGARPNDVWAGGWNILLHFDGAAWTQVTVPLSEPDTQLDRLSGLSSTDIFMSGFAYGSRFPGSTAYFTYHYDGHTWSIVDSAFEAGMFNIAQCIKGIGNIMYGGGAGVFRWTGSSWQKLVETNSAILGVHGLGEDYIFAVGSEATMFHYNGFLWRKIDSPLPDSFDFTDVWTNGKEVFILTRGGNSKSYVLHGK